MITLDYGPKTVLACFMATTTYAREAHTIVYLSTGWIPSLHETAAFNTLLSHLLCRCLQLLIALEYNVPTAKVLGVVFNYFSPGKRALLTP